MYDISSLMGLDEGSLAVIEEYLSISSDDYSNAFSSLGIGTILRFKLLDGSDTEIMVADIKENIATMVHVGCVGEDRRMNPTNSTIGGYEACELRRVLNHEIVNLYPSWLRDQMIPDYYGDSLRLLSNEEVFGNDVHGVPCPDYQLEIMKYLRNRIAFNKNARHGWWLSCVAGSAAFCFVASGGFPAASGASNLYGVRPLFKISLI